MASEINLDPVFLELGKAVLAFQSLETRLKCLLPHLALPETGEPPAGEGWGGWNKYLLSKEMLGNLVRALLQRTTAEDPLQLESAFMSVVKGRNEVVHLFVHQPFASCQTEEQMGEAIEFIRSRRNRAAPLLQLLDHLAYSFLVSLTLPDDFEGEMPLVAPEWPWSAVVYDRLRWILPLQPGTLSLTPMHHSPADTPQAVDAFMAGLDHPAKDVVVALRAAVLGSDPSISEGVKWNAPSFKTTQYFATTHLRAKAGVGLVLHFGAKVRDVAAGQGTIPDPDGLLTWVAKDRATLAFKDAADLHAQRPALQAILRQWIQHV